MDKSEAKGKRLAGRYRRNARSKGSPAKRSEEETNRLIGRHLRKLRFARGVTLPQIGEAIGVSYQAFQKYENGDSAVSAARLKRLAELLRVPQSYFFGDPEGTADDDIDFPVLRLAQKLNWIAQERPEGFAKLRRLINTLMKPQ